MEMGEGGGEVCPGATGHPSPEDICRCNTCSTRLPERSARRLARGRTFAGPALLTRHPSSSSSSSGSPRGTYWSAMELAAQLSRPTVPLLPPPRRPTFGGHFVRRPRWRCDKWLAATAGAACARFDGVRARPSLARVGIAFVPGVWVCCFCLFVSRTPAGCTFRYVRFSELESRGKLWR